MSTIWLDIGNAPHVAFFTPIIRNLRERGHATLVTLRDFEQTRDLVDRQPIDYDTVGKYHRGSTFSKLVGGAVRTASLSRWARGRRIDAAVSYGSRAMVLACRTLGIPCVTVCDHEIVSAVILNRFSRRILLPDLLPDNLLKTLGFDPRRVAKYPGFKEEVYLGTFSPDPSILDRLQVRDSDTLVVVRLPAIWGQDPNRLGEKILQAVFDRIKSEKHAVGVVIPRAGQQQILERTLGDSRSFRVLGGVEDGLNLMWHADLVVGGGDTMNREAAMLGVPVYNVVTGREGAFERALGEQGRMIPVKNLADVARLRVEKRARADDGQRTATWRARSRELVDFISEEITVVASTSRHR